MKEIDFLASVKKWSYEKSEHKLKDQNVHPYATLETSSKGDKSNVVKFKFQRWQLWIVGCSMLQFICSFFDLVIEDIDIQNFIPIGIHKDILKPGHTLSVFTLTLCY